MIDREGGFEDKTLSDLRAAGRGGGRLLVAEALNNCQTVVNFLYNSVLDGKQYNGQTPNITFILTAARSTRQVHIFLLTT